MQWHRGIFFYICECEAFGTGVWFNRMFLIQIQTKSSNKCNLIIACWYYCILTKVLMNNMTLQHHVRSLIVYWNSTWIQAILQSILQLYQTLCFQHRNRGNGISHLAVLAVAHALKSTKCRLTNKLVVVYYFYFSPICF